MPAGKLQCRNRALSFEFYCGCRAAKAHSWRKRKRVQPLANHKIKCEVVQILANKSKCSEVGRSFVIGARTPAGMCARAFAAVYPAALAMRFSDEMSWEQGRGYIDIMCPDNDVTYRLSRIKDA